MSVVASVLFIDRVLSIGSGVIWYKRFNGVKGEDKKIYRKVEERKVKKEKRRS
jgi:hypothetical protein